MSLSQKVILGGVIIVFVMGIGWALQYVSTNDLRAGKGGGTMMNVATDEEGAVVPSRIGKERSQPADQDGALAPTQPIPPTATATIETKSQAEQALLEIESSFGEIEADISTNE